MTDAVFWDRVAPSYAKKPIDDQAAYEATLDRVRGYLSLDMTGLEIGCGTGSTALLLAPHLSSLTATDISTGMIDIARAKPKPPGVDLTFREAPATAQVPGGPFDVVMGFNILHLLRGIDRALPAIAENVKPGGLLITKTPCLGEMSRFLPLVIGAMRLVGKAPFVTNLTGASLVELHERSGFEVIETDRFGAKGRSVFVVARRTA